MSTPTHDAQPAQDPDRAGDERSATSVKARPLIGLVLLAACVALMVAGLVAGFHEPLFFGLGERGGQGIDFFCVPKAFRNLLAGRSAFDTWGGEPYGPYLTWFVLHPAVALWIGAYLSWLPPWGAYAAWVGVTLAMLLGCGLAFARHASSPQRRLLAIAALVASPITYLLLLYGNVHGVIVVAAALLLLGLHELASGAPRALGLAPRTKLTLGLSLSLLCKPVLVLVAPALLLTRATRRPALASLLVYALLSALLVLVPALNPEGVGLGRLAWLALHPEWVRSELEVHAHRFVLLPEMLDSAMHWFHMVAQSSNAWDHVQLFSLPVLLRGVAPDAAGPLRALVLAPVLLSPLLLRVPEAQRAAASAWLVVLALASHFLGYAIAWEYQYAQLLPVAAALLALSTFQVPSPRCSRVALAALALLYLPTPYALLARAGLSAGELVVMRAFRVVPALLVALASASAFVRHVRWRGPLAATGGASVAPPGGAQRGAAGAEPPAVGAVGAAAEGSPSLAARARHGLQLVRQRPVLAATLGLFLLAPPALVLGRRALAPRDPEARAAEVAHLIATSRQLLDTGQARASLTPLARAARLAPDSFAVQNNLCVAYGILERRDEAIESCRRALTIVPEDGLARNNLAWVESIAAK